MMEDSGLPAPWGQVGSPTAAPDVEPWRFPVALQVLGVISAALTIVGLLAWWYTAEFVATPFTGPLVGPEDQAVYYSLIWFNIVASGGQLYAFVRRDVPKLWFMTILRAVALVASMLISPSVELILSIDGVQLLHLGLQVTILVVIGGRWKRR